MITQVNLKNLTVFPEAHLDVSPQLNVIVGENGAGKSHLLKVMYSALAISAEEGKKPNASPPTKGVLQTKLGEKLVNVLRPEALGRLARRKQGHERCEVALKFDDPKLDLAFNFSTKSKSEVAIEKLPERWLGKPPVYLPTRELLSIYPGFVSVYENHYLDFEETWRDTCLLLGALGVRGPRESFAKNLLAPLEEAMGGEVLLDKTGRFYLRVQGQGLLEIPLVAEGIRKLAMVARLIVTGALVDKGTLFWDEPEANLNPKLTKDVAKTILTLCKHGIQVFIATHSLFLMRELDIQLREKQFSSISSRFFGLHVKNSEVNVEQGSSLEDVGSIAALDEELSQSDRYLEME